MATPILQSNQVTGAGAGTPGADREDLELNKDIGLSDTEAANVGGTYQFTLADRPVGSTAALLNATTATPTLTGVNVAGTHPVVCAVTIGGQTYYADILLVVLTAELGLRKIAFGEQDQYNAAGNTRGYAPAYEKLVVAVDTLGTSVAAAEADIADLQANPGGLVYVSANDTTPQTLSEKITVGPGLVATETNDGGDESYDISLSETQFGFGGDIGLYAMMTTDAALTLSGITAGLVPLPVEKAIIPCRGVQLAQTHGLVFEPGNYQCYFIPQLVANNVSGALTIQWCRINMLTTMTAHPVSHSVIGVTTAVGTTTKPASFGAPLFLELTEQTSVLVAVTAVTAATWSLYKLGSTILVMRSTA